MITYPFGYEYSIIVYVFNLKARNRINCLKEFSWCGSIDELVFGTFYLLPFLSLLHDVSNIDRIPDELFWSNWAYWIARWQLITGIKRIYHPICIKFHSFWITSFNIFVLQRI